MPNTIKLNIDLVVDGKHQVVQATTDVRKLGEPQPSERQACRWS